MNVQYVTNIQYITNVQYVINVQYVMNIIDYTGFCLDFTVYLTTYSEQV